MSIRRATDDQLLILDVADKQRLRTKLDLDETTIIEGRAAEDPANKGG